MKITKVLFEMYVGTTHKILLVNSNWLVGVLLQALSPLLPQEVVDSLKTFTASEKDALRRELAQTVSLDFVPKEYGGRATLTKRDHEF